MTGGDRPVPTEDAGGPVVGLDLGDARIGVAISDSERRIAVPVGTDPRHPIILGIPPTVSPVLTSSRSCPRLSCWARYPCASWQLESHCSPGASRRLMLIPIDAGAFVPTTPTNLTHS